MNFEEAIAYMGGLLRFGWKLGNERFTALCERLGNPQNRYDILHVAGTKGKGSTTALAAAMLHEAGYRVGGYFSPYVYDPCERIQVDREMISRLDFARLVTLIRPHVEDLAQTDLGQTTEFELKTALGFLYFAEQKVDIACIEVGIGGRLDATNVVNSAVTVITNIGLDHTDILGETHAQIATEKAGIIKCGIPCITAVDHPDALDRITEIARAHRSPLIQVLRGDASAPTGDPGLVRWMLTSPQSQGLLPLQVPQESNLPSPDTIVESGNDADLVSRQIRIDQDEDAPVTVATSTAIYPNMKLRMGGVYQRGNASCAVAAAERILLNRGAQLPIEAVRRALATTALPGRLEILHLPEGPLVALDGAHNEMAALALAGPVRALRARHDIRRLLLVVGMVGGHDPEGFLAVFAPIADRVYACRPDWRRGQPAEKIAEVARLFTPHVEMFSTVPDAARAALTEATARDMVLVTGSFYTVGEARAEFTRETTRSEREAQR